MTQQFDPVWAERSLRYHWGTAFRPSARRDGQVFVVRIKPIAADEAPAIDPEARFEGRSAKSFADAVLDLTRRIPPLRPLTDAESPYKYASVATLKE